MEIQQIYLIAYILWGVMLFFVGVALVYGITQRIEKAYRFTKKYKSAGRERNPVITKRDFSMEETEETMLLTYEEGTQILLQEESFYGNSLHETNKNVLSTAK